MAADSADERDAGASRARGSARARTMRRIVGSPDGLTAGGSRHHATVGGCDNPRMPDATTVLIQACPASDVNERQLVYLERDGRNFILTRWDGEIRAYRN